MKEFVLIFRMDITNKAAQPSPKQMESYMKDWMHWINGIAKKNKLADGGNHFSRNGRVIKSGDKVIETPYIEAGSSVAGYIMILVNNIDEATIIAKNCPILNGENTSVEIREIESPGL